MEGVVADEVGGLLEKGGGVGSDLYATCLAEDRTRPQCQQKQYLFGCHFKFEF